MLFPDPCCQAYGARRRIQKTYMLHIYYAVKLVCAKMFGFISETCLKIDARKMAGALKVPRVLATHMFLVCSIFGDR